MSEAQQADYKAHCVAISQRFGGIRPHPPVKPVKRLGNCEPARVTIYNTCYRQTVKQWEVNTQGEVESCRND